MKRSPFCKAAVMLRRALVPCLLVLWRWAPSNGDNDAIRVQ